MPSNSFSSTHTHRIKPFITLFVILFLTVGAYYLGSISNNHSSNDNQDSRENDDVLVLENQNNSNLNNEEETKLVSRKLGSFNGEDYYLEWLENKFLEQNIKSDAVLRRISVETGIPTIIGENINIGKKMDYFILSNLTSDYKLVTLDLFCEGCEKRTIILDLESGRSNDDLAILNTVKQRTGLIDCSMLPRINFNQNNLLFNCRNSDDREFLYSYKLSNYSVIDIEELAEGESLVCSENVNDFYQMVYNQSEFVVNICSADNLDLIRETTFEDI